MLNRGFIKNGATLISGNLWAQGISFAAYLLLTRLFSPEDIGLYNIFYSYIEVLVILSTCKYEMAVVIADDDREATAVSRLALRLNTVITLLLLGILVVVHFAFPNSPLDLVNENFYTALLIPPMVFFCGTSRVYNAVLNRIKSFNHIAMSEAIGSTGGVAVKLLLGLPRLAGTWLHSLGLPIGTVVGKMVSNINLLVRVRRQNLPKDITKEERRGAAAKFKNFPIYTMPKEWLNSFSHNLPFLWLALYVDKAEVGLFALALTFTFRPVNILYTAFEKLLYVDIAEKVRTRQSIKDDILKFIKYLNIVALPVCIVAFIFADTIFGFLFGGRWTDCGYYIRCLLPWVYITLTSTSLVFLSNVFSKQRTEFLFYLLLCLLRIVAVVVGVVTGDFRLAVLLFSIAGAAISLAVLIWCLRLVSLFESRTLEGKDNL